MPDKSWNRRVDCFKIHKVEGEFERFELPLEVWAEPRLTCLYRRTCTPLNLAQLEIGWYVVDGLDTHFLQLCHRAGMKPGKVANVVMRHGGIAVGEELADDRIDAV